MVAPVIPGLNDSEIPAILREAKEAGASSAAMILLRLPLTVEPVFLEWLERTQPLKKDRVLSRIRSTRGGQLSDSRFGRRMHGEGEIAKQIRRTFDVFCRKLGLAYRIGTSKPTEIAIVKAAGDENDFGGKESLERIDLTLEFG